MQNRVFTRRCAGLAAALATAASALAQTGDKPLSQDELLRQIESLSPAATDPGRRLPAVMPVPGAPRAVSRTAAALPEADALFPEAADAGKPKAEKKRKGATEIVALEATFDQKAHIAIFTGQVVVTDPEFNVQADKLTAYLKHDDKGEGTIAPRLQAAPAPEGKKDKGPAKGGGLEKALAEADAGGIVIITQDKEEADGSISHSIGRGKKVMYDASTGEITLYGRPDVQQGINTCVATEEGTVMILNRDGHMRVTGAHKTVIKDQGDSKK